MKIIQITANKNGSRPPMQDWPGAVPPAGYAAFPEKFLPIFYPADKRCAGFVDITVMADSTVTSCTWNEEAYQAYIASLPEPDDPIIALKAQRTADSKTALAEYLASHPLMWTDGKPYSVTEEKQSLLMGNIAAYQIEVQSDPDAVVTWNASGEECVPWEFTELCALAVAIKNYVKPLVSYQQAVEIAINSCETVEDVEAIVIDYSTVYNA